MKIDEAKQLLHEYLLQYVSSSKPYIAIGKVIDSNNLGYTIEGGVCKESKPTENELVWWEIDSKTGKVESCLIG